MEAVLRAFGLVLLVPFLVACRSEATGLVVLVDSDFAVPDELATIQISVLDEEGTEVSSQAFAVAPGSDIGPAELALPFSLGVAPRGGDASRRVDVVVMGLGPGDLPLVTRRARTGFIEGETRLLRMFLARSCRDVMCAADATCTEDGCVSIEVPPATLPPIEPGQELDASGRDGGADDAGMEGGVLDAGVDASAMDGGATDGGAETTVRFVRSAGSGSCGASLSVSTPAIAVGRTLIVTVGYRGGPVGPVVVSDSTGNVYRPELVVIDVNPRLAVFSTTIGTALSGGDTISVSYPSGATSAAVIVDELEGVATAMNVANSGRSDGRGTAVSVGMTTVVPRFLYAVEGNHDRTIFTPSSSGWSDGGSVVAMCGGVPGFMTLRAYRRVAPSGAQLFEGTFTGFEDWSTVLLAISSQ